MPTIKEGLQDYYENNNLLTISWKTDGVTLEDDKVIEILAREIWYSVKLYLDLKGNSNFWNWSVSWNWNITRYLPQHIIYIFLMVARTSYKVGK